MGMVTPPMGNPLKPSLVEWKLPDFAVIYLQGASLETFLSGMETEKLETEVKAFCALKPSLVEWKHKKQYRYMSAEFALKPSLVEWKLPPIEPTCRASLPLKPSLVEWKLFVFGCYS